MSDDGWIVVGRAADVPLLEGRSVLVSGRRVAVFRLPGGWAAVDHACPHRLGPLADGIVTETCVTCPLHGWRFDLRTGRREGGTEAIAAHQVRQRADLLELRLADDPAAARAA
jgi:nitrite reductase (NADH) small subunit